nr:hypothetical protein [Tanacetum cinerariifolium]
MHAPVEWKLYDSCKVHHVTAKYKEIFMLVEKDYPLRKGLEIVMICCKFQMENYSQMASDLILKIHKIASSPRQLVTSLFFRQWELSSLAVGTSSASKNSMTGSGNALCILFLTILP